MTEDHAERIGRLADALDAVLYATRLPMPAQLHLEALKDQVRSTRDELAKMHIEATGSNPWETNPHAG